MKKKSIIIILIAVIAVATVGIGVVAVKPGLLFDITSSKDPELKQQKAALPESLKTISGLENVTELLYKESEYDADTKIYDVFGDGDGNEYKFAVDGKLVGFKRFAERVSSKSSVEPVSNDEAKELCEEYARTLFGDHFDGYTMQSIDYSDHDKCFNYGAVLFCGEDKSIEKTACYVTLSAPGELREASIGRYYQFIGFDDSLLDGVSRDALNEFGTGQLRQTVPDAEITKEPGLSLEKIGDKYAVKVRIEYSSQNAGGGVFSAHYEL